MVSLGTHLVKNHESQSRTNESQLKKTISPKLKMLGHLCNHADSLSEDTQKLILHSTLKSKCSPSILTHSKG